MPNARTIAIVDDDPDWRASISSDLREIGYEPIEIGEVNFADERLFADFLATKARVVLCDHHLRHRNYALFDGAGVAARLYERRIPAVLVTQYQDTDDLVLKRWRRKLPVVLNKDQLDTKSLENAINISAQEADGKPVTHRRMRRVLIIVDEIRGDEPQAQKVVAFVPSWNRQRAVEFPLTLIPGNLRSSVLKGTTLLGSVNIGALTQDELFFEGIEIAPEPDSEDGLA